MVGNNNKKIEIEIEIEIEKVVIEFSHSFTALAHC